MYACEHEEEEQEEEEQSGRRWALHRDGVVERYVQSAYRFSYVIDLRVRLWRITWTTYKLAAWEKKVSAESESFITAVRCMLGQSLRRFIQCNSVPSRLISPSHLRVSVLTQTEDDSEIEPTALRNKSTALKGRFSVSCDSRILCFHSL